MNLCCIGLQNTTLVSDAESMLITTKCFCAGLPAVFAVQVVLNMQVDSLRSLEMSILLLIQENNWGRDKGK